MLFVGGMDSCSFLALAMNSVGKQRWTWFMKCVVSLEIPGIMEGTGNLNMQNVLIFD
jgi:hypothetical protein